MSGLTTHVLDLTSGRPAAAVGVRLFAKAANTWTPLVAKETDPDGRARLLEGQGLVCCAYRLEFDLGAYFRAQGVAAADPGFLETVAIEFNIADARVHHHVPLLASPYGYTTYRGS